MHEYAVDSVKQENIFCEALSMTQEAERLQEMTLSCFGIEVDEADVDPDASDGEECDDEIGVSGIDVCVSRVQSAALAVVTESRRFQIQTERYAAQLLGSSTSGDDELEATPEDRAGVGGSYEKVLEALELAREAEQLQERLVRLLARILHPSDKDETHDG